VSYLKKYGILLFIFLLFSFISPVKAGFEPLVATELSEEYTFSLPRHINVVKNGKASTVTTFSKTTKSYIDSLNVDGEVILISPKEHTFIYEGMQLQIEVYLRERKTIVEDIPFSNKDWYVTGLAYGSKRIKQEGIPGKKQIVKDIYMREGKPIKEKVISQTVLSQPTEQITEIGTTRVYKTATIDGHTFQYWRTLTVVATSYDHTCKGCNHFTATGWWLTKGIVAVDPRVIPLGTKMYVPGYGFGNAQDTGGAIKGNRIDLAFDDIRYGNWSKRTVTIYIID
jgi:3D (Asp-Asp-Asp) domain-containing protein